MKITILLVCTMAVLAAAHPQRYGNSGSYGSSYGSSSGGYGGNEDYDYSSGGSYGSNDGYSSGGSYGSNDGGYGSNNGYSSGGGYGGNNANQQLGKAVGGLIDGLLSGRR